MRDLDAQTFGSAFVIIAFASAEAAAQMLTHYPGSAWLWFCNLEIFIEFEHARIASSPIRYLFGPLSLACWSVLLLATILSRKYKNRLITSIIANFCFACAVGLLLPHSEEAVFNAAVEQKVFMRASNPSNLLLLTISMVSFAAFAVSHISFFKRIFFEEFTTKSRCEFLNNSAST